MYNNSFAQKVIFIPEGYDLDVYPLTRSKEILSEDEMPYTLHFNNLKDAVDKGVELAINNHDQTFVIFPGGDYIWYSDEDGTDNAFEIAIACAAKWLSCHWYDQYVYYAGYENGKQIRRRISRNRPIPIVSD